MPHPVEKRKRGRPRKEAVEQRAEGDSPLWAMVDYLALIHDDLKQQLELAKSVIEPAQRERQRILESLMPPPGA